MLRPAVFAALVLTLTDAAHALDPERRLTQYRLASWRAEDGLLQDSVESILQTRDGYLWLGTLRGLVRFDGVRFTPVADPVLSGRPVIALLESKDGSLWVGTDGAGLARRTAQGWTRYTSREGLAHDFVAALHEDGQGRVWVGTRGGGLSRFEAGRFTTVSREAGLVSDRVRDIAEDAEGALWVATREGLHRLRGGAVEVFGPAQGLPDPFVVGVLPARDGALWVGTRQGLVRGSGGRFSAPRAGWPAGETRALLQTEDGSIWAGSEGGGLARIREGGTETLTPAEGLPDPSVRSLYEDREGNLWIGTRGGLARLSQGPFATWSSREGLPGGEVRGLQVSGDAVAVATEKGVGRIRAGRVEPIVPPAEGWGSPVTDVVEDGDSLWVGTDGTGLLHRQGGRWTRLTTRDGLPSGYVYTLRLARDGTLWVGLGGGGLARVRDDRVLPRRPADQVAAPSILAMLEDASGTMWLGTRGLGLWRVAGEQAERLAGVPADTVTGLSLGRDGALWIGTYGAGLARWKDGRLTTCGTAQGMPEGVVFQALEDAHGDLWVSGYGGVARLERSGVEACLSGAGLVRGRAFGRAAGLRSAEGTTRGAVDAQGRLWFGTLDGMAVVDPARLDAPAPPPPLLLEEVEVDGATRAAAPLLHFEPGPRHAEVRWTGLRLGAPEDVRFSYQLLGTDEDWVDAGERRAAWYTRLPPGRHVFQVRARTGDGPWGPAGQMTLDFAPRFAETPHFKALAALALAGLGALVVRLRMARVQRRARELEAAVREAVANVRALSGLLPICASCKKIRDDTGYWQQVEVYLREHTEATFSHGMCDDCVRELYPDIAEQVLGQRKAR